jgi:tetratricopeptide (TPR) repeat protein
MTHYETEEDVDHYYDIIHTIIKKASNSIYKNGSQNNLAKYHFYRGSAYGYLAYSLGKNGHWLKAYDNGLASIDDLEISVQYDSTLYDAYLGIGVYNYWLSTKLKFMLWLPFIPDKREQGIEGIKLAIDKGLYSQAMGMHQLIYILLDYGRFDEAIPYAEKVIELYPESQFMRWAHAHVYYKRHEYDKAIDSYFKLMELIESDEQSNPSHWLFCQTRIAEIYFKQGQYGLASRHALRALEYKTTKPLKKKEKEKLDQAADILSKSQKALDKDK